MIGAVMNFLHKPLSDLAPCVTLWVQENDLLLRQLFHFTTAVTMGNGTSGEMHTAGTPTPTPASAPASQQPRAQQTAPRPNPTPQQPTQVRALFGVFVVFFFPSRIQFAAFTVLFSHFSPKPQLEYILF